MKPITRRTLIRTMLYSGVLCAGTSAYAQSDNLEIVYSDVQIKGLAANLDGLTLGILSDFHAGGPGNEAICLQSIETIRQLRPDLICLIGDFVDGHQSRDAENINNALFLFKALDSLTAPRGVFAVLGNHDHWTDAKRVTRLLTESGVKVLFDEHLHLGDGLMLAGVDDYWEGPGNSYKALSGIQPEQPTILLSHNPDINGELPPSSPVRLVISGHTHGGQIRIPVTGWAPWVPCDRRYSGASGHITETATRSTFISKGVGTFLLPLRFSCPPDIALLTLRAAAF